MSQLALGCKESQRLCSITCKWQLSPTLLAAMPMKRRRGNIREWCLFGQALNRLKKPNDSRIRGSEFEMYRFLKAIRRMNMMFPPTNYGTAQRLAFVSPAVETLVNTSRQDIVVPWSAHMSGPQIVMVRDLQNNVMGTFTSRGRLAPNLNQKADKESQRYAV